MALEGVARDRVLQSLKDAVPRGLVGMSNELRAMRQAGESISLANFLAHSGLDLEDVYANGRSWSDLLEAAEEPVAPNGPHEAPLRKACARLLHLDDPERLRAYSTWLNNPEPPSLEAVNQQQRRWLRMLLATLTSSISAIAELPTSQGAQLVWAHPQVRAELLELFTWLKERVHHLGYELTQKINVPLRVHARYSRAEIQAGFGDAGADADEHTLIQVPPWREGVKFMRQEGCDVFLITLTKTEKRFSPTTRYRDYAISRNLFHWESQSRTTADSPTGQRYQHQRKQGT
jgi:phosphoserine phosphatase